MDLLVSILISGFIIGAINALGAAGLTIIFGVSGILNLAHGAIVVLAAMFAWYCSVQLGLNIYISDLIGIGVAVIVTYLLYALVIMPVQRSRHLGREELHVSEFVATIMVMLILQGLMLWFFGGTTVTTPPLLSGTISIGGNAVPINNLFIGVVAWVVLGGLWVFISFTGMGKAMLAASMSTKGLAIIGYDIGRIYIAVWGLYGLLAGIAGVLLGSFIGANGSLVINLTVTAFIIVVLGGLGNVFGSLVAAYILGFLGTLTAFLISPALRAVPGLVLLIVVLYIRPQGLFGRRSGDF